jgi:hypothetical protein
MAYVYCHIRFDDHSPFYIGIGRTKKRMFDLLSRSDWHKRTVKIHGVIFENIIKDVDWSVAKWWEIRWIKALKASGFNLVNMTEGGDGMSMPSPELRKKLSVSQKKRFQNAEERKKLSLAFTGRVTSEKTKKILSEKSLGRNHTQETIEKMKEFAKKRGVSQKCREAQKLAVTGKKRAPFTEETILKMRIASKEREAKKRLLRGAK